MLRRTEGSSKEEQIYQKEQILAELQVTDDMMMHYTGMKTDYMKTKLP